MKCQKEIKGNGVFRWRQCKNEAVVQRGETWYCSVHDPEKENERYLTKYLKKKK